jgi:hypothetical protein
MKQLRLLTKRLLAYLPSRFPTGMTELNKWIDDIVELTGPIADRDSIVYVAGHETVAMKNTTKSVSKMEIVKRIRKMAFNQLMSSVLMEISKRHEAEKLAAKQAEATTTPIENTASGNTPKDYDPQH